MRFLLLLLLPVWLLAHTYVDLLALLESNYRYQSEKALQEAAESLYQAAQGKNLPSLDASLSAIEFNEVPSMTISTFGTTAPVGTKKHAEGALILAYPLFSGFAISAAIDKAKLQSEQASLKLSNLKRNLAVQTTFLYSAIIAEEKTLLALESSYEAIKKAYAKAKGYYDNGLLAQSELFAIQAKQYDIQSQIFDHQNAREQYLNQLRALLNANIVSIDSNGALSFNLPNEKELMQTALEEREDLQALARSIDVAQSNVTLAQSTQYPNVALVGVLKHQGDSLELNGDGYTNADKSYVGLSVSWNLFNGFSDARNIDAARAAKLSAFFDLEAYKQEVTTEVGNGFLELHTLENKLLSAQEELSASQTYAALSQGRFDNQLISADELSRSLASLASSEAKVFVIQSRLFNQKARLWLLCGWNAFEKQVHLK
jgi:outer membrane protein TolC